jgi:hypothetical protein
MFYLFMNFLICLIVYAVFGTITIENIIRLVYYYFILSTSDKKFYLKEKKKFIFCVIFIVTHIYNSL